MAFNEDRQAEAIAAEWDVPVELLTDTSWELDTIDGNDDHVYSYLVRFNDTTDPVILAQLGLGPGEFTRQLSVNAFDEPELEDFEFAEPLERSHNGRRAYYIDGERFTPSEFRRLSRARKVEAMIRWFHENYEDPAVRTPYESREGGYQWIWGGPYDAREEIGDEFSDVADESVIEQAVDDVTRDGFDWAPKERREDYDQEEEPDDGTYSLDAPFPDISNVDGDEEDTNQSPALPSGQAYLTDENGGILTDEHGRGLIVNVPTSDETLRREILSRLDNLEVALQTYHENLPARNHNHPPELVEPDPLPPQELRIVVQVARELREEAQQPQPDPVKLEVHASALRKAAGSILSWIGRKVDTGIDGIITWGVPLGGYWLLAHPEKVYAALTAVAETASALANYLLP